MSRTLTVAVTEEHIKRGARENSERCPIALALGEEVPESVHICWNLTTGFLDKEVIYAVMPEADIVSRWVYDFDEGRQVEPFTLVVEYEEV